MEAVEAAFLTFVDTGDRLEDKVEEFRSHKGPVINDVIGFVKQIKMFCMFWSLSQFGPLFEKLSTVYNEPLMMWPSLS